MGNKEVKECRYRRRKNLYRMILGVQQFINYPFLNIIWVLFAVVIFGMIKGAKVFVKNVEVASMFSTIFPACIKIVVILVSLILVIGILQLVGYGFAVRDESDMEYIFGNRLDAKKQYALLIYKRKDTRTGVIKRQFATTIPLHIWRDNKETLCDIMNICLVSEIGYGGKKKNNGRRVCFESVKGRKPPEREVLYDEIK